MAAGPFIVDYSFLENIQKTYHETCKPLTMYIPCYRLAFKQLNITLIQSG